MLDKTKIVITGLLCITGLEAIALFMGVNGTLFAITIGTIAAGIGIVVPKSVIPKPLKFLRE